MSVMRVVQFCVCGVVTQLVKPSRCRRPRTLRRRRRRRRRPRGAPGGGAPAVGQHEPWPWRSSCRHPVSAITGSTAATNGFSSTSHLRMRCSVFLLYSCN